jgi:ferritin
MEAIGLELHAANKYKYFATCLQYKGYFGCQKYFNAEAEEELKHHRILTDFMNDRGDEADMPKVEAIDEDHDELLSAFMSAYDFEVELEEFYQDFYKSTKDVTIQQFLLQFLEIQKKSIGEYGDLIARLELCGDNQAALLMFDHEIGE